MALTPWNGKVNLQRPNKLRLTETGQMEKTFRIFLCPIHPHSLTCPLLPLVDRVFHRLPLVPTVSSRQKPKVSVLRVRTHLSSDPLVLRMFPPWQDQRICLVIPLLPSFHLNPQLHPQSFGHLSQSKPAHQRFEIPHHPSPTPSPNRLLVH